MVFQLTILNDRPHDWNVLLSVVVDVREEEYVSIELFSVCGISENLGAVGARQVRWRGTRRTLKMSEYNHEQDK